jgi:hypothetical protein
MRNIKTNPADAKLDEALDVALAKFSSAEPRAGLEERVLANMRAARSRATDPAWWRWAVAAAVAAVIVVSMVLVWKPGRLTSPVMTNHAPVTVTPSPPLQVAGRDNNAGRLPKVHVRKTRVRPSVTQAVAADAPKRDRFPSPQPLTEEELALVQYVRQFPQEAVTIAHAQEQFEKELWQESNAIKKAEPSDSD